MSDGKVEYINMGPEQIKEIIVSLIENGYFKIGDEGEEIARGIAKFHKAYIEEMNKKDEKKVTLSDVLQKINTLQSGEFTIPQLYSAEEWSEFTPNSRKVVGKQFAELVDELGNIKAKGKNSANLTTYEKIN